MRPQGQFSSPQQCIAGLTCNTLGCVCFSCPRCEDDLTHKLVEIIRANLALRRMITNGSPQHILNEYVSLLQVSPGWCSRTQALAAALSVGWPAAGLYTCRSFSRLALGGLFYTADRASQDCAVSPLIRTRCVRTGSRRGLCGGMCVGNTPLPACCCRVQFHVVTYMDNTIPGVNPATQRSGRPIKSISQVRGVCTRRVQVSVLAPVLHVCPEPAPQPLAALAPACEGWKQAGAEQPAHCILLTPYCRVDSVRLVSCTRSG